jgi:Cu/Ag efflux protein CusF
MMRWIPVLLLLAVAACNHHDASKRYPVQGDIKALDPASKIATIDAGPIGDWMGAMTMEYPVKPDADFQKLHVGDHIEGTVVVNDPTFYVTDVKVVPKQ